MEKNEFENFAKSICFEEDVRGSPISEMNKTQPIEFCIAAKKYIKSMRLRDGSVQVLPVLQNNEVQKPQEIDFGSENGKHIALECPSIPPMYVYFNDPGMYHRFKYHYELYHYDVVIYNTV